MLDNATPFESVRLSQSEIARLLVESGVLQGVAAPEEAARSLDVGVVRCGPNECVEASSGQAIWVVVRGRAAVVHDGVRVYTAGPGRVIGVAGFFSEAGQGNAAVHATHPRENVLLELRVPYLRALDTEQGGAISRNLAALLAATYVDGQKASARLIQHVQDLQVRMGSFTNRYVEDRTDAAGTGELVSQRVNAVIWFSDVTGFSEIVRGMSVDETTTVARSFLHHQYAHIEKCGGFVDKFMGDGVMAYWPHARTEQDRAAKASDAATAALDLAASVEEMESMAGHRAAMRIGLHLGEVVFGNFGTPMRWQYTLIGHCVNVAARLEQYKPDGEREPFCGATRISKELYDVLPAGLQRRFQDNRSIRVKHDQHLEIFTG